MSPIAKQDRSRKRIEIILATAEDILLNKGIEEINENISDNNISECSSCNITENQNNSPCSRNPKCNVYFSASRGRKICVPKDSIKIFQNGQGIMGFNDNKFKIIKSSLLSILFKCITLILWFLI